MWLVVVDDADETGLVVVEDLDEMAADETGLEELDEMVADDADETGLVEVGDLDEIGLTVKDGNGLAVADVKDETMLMVPEWWDGLTHVGGRAATDAVRSARAEKMMVFMMRD
ncbi:hypothetical protein BDK51DRAFT_31633 [Blyttiomyces helicus]|uniref:Uncharacterized protein n=1 Tax=Blyttiomyces helicus TaxID=388810 RepID=A0A4P9WBF0_9FUNG|nr:hypothetical protein BDK51DRAFT_31633 [Blyttiomyces helicus]|eukprot:RKO89951.1 hypothetical protein BDK51DRAFT_31633 [Blyttiomyces helicus]